MKRPFWRKTEENQNNNSCSENNYEEITTDRFGNCQKPLRDCAATIVTEQFTRTRKGVGTTYPAFPNEIRAFFSRIPESGGVSGSKLKLFYTNF